MPLCFTYLDSPIGPIEISGDDDFISTVTFVSERKPEADALSRVVRDCKQELVEYFEGKRKVFTVPLSQSGTDFQRQVWTELTHIPFGKTSSYLHIAQQIGNTKSIRAVGAANGRNNIAIIVPCHRVIGTNGTLVGYAGGLDKKKWLLDFESGISGQQSLTF